MVLPDPLVDWYAARMSCLDLGGTLITIPNAEIQDVLTTEIARMDTASIENTGFWIGLHRTDWYWQDGT